MKRIAGGLLTAVLLTGATLAIGLGPAASQQQAAESFVLCTQEKSGSDRFIDVGRKGFSPGDYSVSVKPLLDPETGERRGQSVSKFTFVRAIGKNNGRGFLDGTYELETGDIAFYGSFKFSDESVPFAITGGNGAYSNVGGTITDASGRCRGEPGGMMQFEVAHN